MSNRFKAGPQTVEAKKAARALRKVIEVEVSAGRFDPRFVERVSGLVDSIETIADSLYWAEYDQWVGTLDAEV